MKATLTTLTPVHIGNGTTYNKNIDFIQSENKIGIIDEKKVLNLIGTENINQWVSAIDNGGNEFFDLLKQRGWNNELEHISSRICELKNTETKSTQLKEQYRTAIKGACIPGSSLKGAIKTCIFDYLTSDDDFINQCKIDDLKIGNKEKWSDSQTDNKIFGKTANEKSTRFLKIGDIHFGNINTDIINVGILDKYHEQWDFKLGQQYYAESIPSGATTNFQMKIDTILLEKNIEKYPSLWNSKKTEPFNNGVENLCEIINGSTISSLNFELATLENENIDDNIKHTIINTLKSLILEIENRSENEIIIRIGANSGWRFTTAAWVLKLEDQMNENQINSLRKTIQKKDYSNMELWPKTRKISTDGQLFGFVKIKIHE
ncbi:MAG: type III-A CRISPR-associated RAMP protein Csm5 [Bacteroidetes bacterium GWA2_32_17]|nr:MAG: type III-A CRISPR-associated RAMP protein Csm5 [Bacteroidetes bacterium GWA2_32_17]